MHTSGRGGDTHTYRLLAVVVIHTHIHIHRLLLASTLRGMRNPGLPCYTCIVLLVAVHKKHTRTPACGGDTHTHTHCLRWCNTHIHVHTACGGAAHTYAHTTACGGAQGCAQPRPATQA
eukprot:scaffold239685_cov28-Tisochrysis_lutea.AAC.1